MSIKLRKKQLDYWESLAKADPDAAVIDPVDKAGYKNSYIVGIRNQVIHEQLKELKNINFVLDFGCGSGLTTEYLFLKDMNVIGIDISLTLLKRACKRILGKHLPVLQYDGQRMPFRSGTLDAIVTYVVLNHLIKEEQLSSVLQELHRILNNNGIIVAVEQTRRTKKLNKEGNKKQLSINEFKRIFAESGFAVKKVKIIRFGHFPLIYLVRTGLIKQKWFGKLSLIESLIGKFHRTPIFDYADTLFVLKKQS